MTVGNKRFRCLFIILKNDISLISKMIRVQIILYNLWFLFVYYAGAEMSLIRQNRPSNWFLIRIRVNWFKCDL